MRKFKIILLMALSAPLLSGCLVIGAAALATDVTVKAVSTTVGVAAGVGGAAIDLVVPDGDDEDQDCQDR
jgi:hypothetical protein